VSINNSLSNVKRNEYKKKKLYTYFSIRVKIKIKQKFHIY